MIFLKLGPKKSTTHFFAWLSAMSLNHASLRSSGSTIVFQSAWALTFFVVTLSQGLMVSSFQMRPHKSQWSHCGGLTPACWHWMSSSNLIFAALQSMQIQGLTNKDNATQIAKTSLRKGVWSQPGMKPEKTISALQSSRALTTAQPAIVNAGNSPKKADPSV